MYRAFRLIARLLLGVLCLVSGPLLAGTGQLDSLPIAGKKIRNAARLEIDTRWVSGIGYRPVHISIINHPPGPTTSDRDFRVVFRPRSYPNHDIDGSVQQIVEMPENATAGSAWISIPQFNQWHSLDIEVYEGGSRIPELCGTFQVDAMNRGWANVGFDECTPGVLFIDSNVPSRAVRQSIVLAAQTGGKVETTNLLPDIRHWQNMVPQNSNYNPGMIPTVAPLGNHIGDPQILLIAEQLDKVQLLPPSELPDNWLNYTCLDLIFISLPEAEKLAEQYPERWQAIVDWAASGPSLIITGVGKDLDKIAAVEKLVKLTPTTDEARSAWEKPQGDYARRSLRAMLHYGRYGNRQAYDSNGNLIVIGEDNNPVTDTRADAFAIRKLGVGRVAVMSADKAMSDPPLELIWLLNQIDGNKWMSYQRNGVSFTQENPDFVSYMLSGTGRVPVYSFLILISLFSIVIGPVNYLLLKRWRRLYLLLVTVPAGAVIVTLCLFGYALVSDGLGVQMRARSYTKLDQQTGRMTMWARQAYYAGVAPSGGLKYPTDAAVFPISERPASGDSQRELVWNEFQQLRAGYITSRRSTQFLVQRSGTSELKVDVQTSKDGPPRVTNKLGVPIVQLLLRDRNGDYFLGSNLEADGSATLSPSDAVAGTEPFRKLYINTKPAPPEGYQFAEHAGNLWGFDRYNPYYYARAQNFQSGLPLPTFATSVLELHLQQAVQGGNDRLEPGTYRAILVKSPEMPLGYSRVQERDSFHMLEGRW